MFKTVTDKEKLLALFYFFSYRWSLFYSFVFYMTFLIFFHYWLLLCLIDFCRFMFFIKCETFSSLILHISFLHFSFPISGTYFLYILIYLMMLHWSLSLGHFFSFFFLFATLNNFSGPLFKFADSFFCQLKSTIKVLYWSVHFSYCTCNFRISVWFLFYNFCLFTIFSIWWNILLLEWCLLFLLALIYNLFQYLYFFRDSLC